MLPAHQEQGVPHAEYDPFAPRLSSPARARLPRLPGPRRPGQVAAAQVQRLDAKVGGSYQMSFTNFSNGQSHSFGGEYLELVPNERLRYTDRFDDPNLPGLMETSITLKPVSCGTELQVVQEGVPDVIPAEACYVGWQECLVLLGKLVEAEVTEK